MEPGHAVGDVVAQDRDEGEASVAEYMLLSESAGKGFTLGRYSGTLTVTAELDRESNQLIRLRALVKNPGPISGQSQTYAW